MPGFAPLAAMPLASAGLPLARKAESAGVFALGASAQGRAQADAMALGAVVFAGQARGRISAQVKVAVAGDTGTLTLAGQSRAAALQDAQVDAAVSVFGAARTAAHAAAAGTATIIIDSDAWAKLTDTGRITSDYVAQGQAAGVTGATATSVPAIAINLDLTVLPSNEAHAAGAIPFTARQGAKAAITAHADVLWQAEHHKQSTTTAVDGEATRVVSLEGAARSFSQARAIGADSMALAGAAYLAGFTSLRAHGGVALAGRSRAITGTQAITANALTLTGQAGAIAQEDRFATSASHTSLSGGTTAQTRLIGRTSGHIAIGVQAKTDTAVLGHGRSGVSIARHLDAAANVDAAMAQAIIFAGASAALTASATRKTITARLPLSGHAQVQAGTDVAAATAVPVGIASVGRVGLRIGASRTVHLPSTLTGATELSGTATKTVVLAGITGAAPRTTAQIAPTPLALTGFAQATPGLAAKSAGQLALTRQSRTSALIDASAGPALHLQLQATAAVPLRASGLTALSLQGAARLPIRITATAHGRFDLIGAGQSAVVMHAAAGAGFDLDAVAGAEVAAGARAQDRFTVTRGGAGTIAVRGDAARLITVTGLSVLRVTSRALAQPALAQNLHAAGVSGLQGELSAQAIRPDGTCQASMTVDAAVRDGSWPLTLLAFGVRAPPGQRRFTSPDTVQGGSIITVPRSGVLRAEPRTGRILKG